MKTSERVHDLFLNYACNAKCAFCYNPPITEELLFRETSFADAAESLYRAARRGCRRLNLHGGEVTLRDDLRRLLALARKLGFRHVAVVTNGVRLGDAQYARGLVDSGANEFRVSLHGSTAERHDRIVRLPGAFDKACAGVGHLRALGVPVGVNFVVHAQNLGDLPAALIHYHDALGLRDFIVYYPHYRGMAELNAGTLRVSYPEVAAALREVFAALEARGSAEALYVANLPPCVLPERESQILDWSAADAAGDSLGIPEGDTRDVGEMKHEQRVKAPSCGRCRLDKACSGFEPEYARLYGSADFQPLEAR